MCLCVYVWVSNGCKKRVLAPLELELQGFVRRLMGGLGINPGPLEESEVVSTS